MPDIIQQAQKPIGEALAKLQAALIQSVKDNGRYATGDTVASIKIVQTETRAQLVAAPYFYALEQGRKPTKQGATKGDPTLYTVIQKWCKAKGIDVKAAWPIAQSIHQNGYPGRIGVISGPLSKENVSAALAPALGDIAGLFGTAVVEGLRKGIGPQLK